MRKIAPLVWAAALYSGTAHADEATWTVSEASAGVTIVHAGRSLVAQRNGRVAPGDIVITGTNARAVLVRGEEYAMVAPNSRLEIARAPTPGGLTQLLESFGNAIYSIRKGATPHFTVQTPYLAAVVKGTTFSVTVDATGASVQVVEGAVEVATRDGGARFVAHPGDIASIAVSKPGALTIQGNHNQVINSTGPAAGQTAPAATVAKPSATAAATVTTTPAPVTTPNDGGLTDTSAASDNSAKSATTNNGSASDTSTKSNTSDTAANADSQATNTKSTSDALTKSSTSDTGSSDDSSSRNSRSDNGVARSTGNGTATAGGIAIASLSETTTNYASTTNGLVSGNSSANLAQSTSTSSGANKTAKKQNEDTSGTGKDKGSSSSNGGGNDGKDNKNDNGKGKGKNKGGNAATNGGDTKGSTLPNTASTSKRGF